MYILDTCEYTRYMYLGYQIYPDISMNLFKYNVFEEKKLHSF